MNYIGDIAIGQILYFAWQSNAIAGESITRATNGTISVYKNDGTTQSTAGVTDTEDFDGVTGVHMVKIDTSADGTFYSAGADFTVVLSGATIDGKTINAVLGGFSINNRSALRPTTAGRTIDVSAGGEAGVDWANVGSPTTVVGLTGTTVKTATDVETDTQDIQARLPAALVSGRIDASVGAMAADVVTASAIAADAIGSSELAASAVTEIQSGLATAAALATAQTSIDDIPTNAELAASQAAADDATLAAIAALNNLSQANVRSAVGLASANLDTQLDALPTNAELATALAAADDAVLAAVAGVSAKVDTVDDFLDTEVAAIKTVTDQLVALIDAIPTALENADALLKRDMSAVTGEAARSPLNALRAIRNKVAIAAGTMTVYKEDDTTAAFTAAVTTTAGNPISEVDPT